MTENERRTISVDFIVQLYIRTTSQKRHHHNLCKKNIAEQDIDLERRCFTFNSTPVTSEGEVDLEFEVEPHLDRGPISEAGRNRSRSKRLDHIRHFMNDAKL